MTLQTLSVGENIQVTYRETKTTGAGGSIESADDESEILAAVVCQRSFQYTMSLEVMQVPRLLV